MQVVDRDWIIRQYAFRFVEDLALKYEDVIPGGELQRGFEFEGERIHVSGVPGIWKPKSMDLPISIRTGIDDPYGDEIGDDGCLAYRYFKQNPQHPDNVGLRACMRQSRPLVYFRAVAKSLYAAVWPMFIIADDPGSLTFTLACDDPAVMNPSIAVDVAEDARRHYSAHVAVTRLHQAKFRQRILAAYRQSCTICHLKHVRLLDAAHILPDLHERGDPVVPNGLALCKIHHAAFDTNILGIRPDHVVEIRSDILEETDGPMLRHGLQELHGARLAVLPRRPEDRPDPERLEVRYDEFRAAG